MQDKKAWLKEHAVEVIGVVVAAVIGLLLIAKSKGGGASKSATVSPGAINTPAVSSGGGGGGSSGLTASDVQAALAGYVTTAQEQGDIGGLTAALDDLRTSSGSALSTAISQVTQAQAQNSETVANNLKGLADSFTNLSQQYAGISTKQGDQAGKLADLYAQLGSTAKKGDLGIFKQILGQSLDTQIAAQQNHINVDLGWIDTSKRDNSYNLLWLPAQQQLQQLQAQRAQLN